MLGASPLFTASKGRQVTLEERDLPAARTTVQGFRRREGDAQPDPPDSRGGIRIFRGSSWANGFSKRFPFEVVLNSVGLGVADGGLAGIGLDPLELGKAIFDAGNAGLEG